MKMAMGLNSLPMMRKVNNTIIKLYEDKHKNNIPSPNESLHINNTHYDEQDVGSARNIEFGFYLGILVILSAVTLPPSLTVIGHILM